MGDFYVMVTNVTGSLYSSFDLSKEVLKQWGFGGK